ncbi:MAG TPA: hypothetical protein ENI29_14695 [bacterium]|nr:hypothetical protein [bacterium]
MASIKLIRADMMNKNQLKQTKEMYVIGRKVFMLLMLYGEGLDQVEFNSLINSPINDLELKCLTRY